MSRIRLDTRVALYVASAAATLSATPQAALAAESIDDLQVVVVTAQKREENIRDVPITISATSGERMRELGVSDLDELAFYIPGLNVQEQSANNPGIVIRGITSDSGSAQQAARVTLYYNGVDISRSRGSYQDIYDMERIEVIKGPQATLFGTASAIGAISLISARPKSGFSGAIEAGLGNYGQQLLAGHLNAGDETLATRIAFAWKQRQGYVENLAPNQDDLNGQDQLGMRGSIRYTPSDDTTIDAIVTWDRQRNPGTAFVSKALPTAAGPGDPFGKAFLGGSPLSATVLGKTKLGLDRDVYDVNLTINHSLSERWSLTTVNGYRRFDSLETFDADGSAAWYLEFAEIARGTQGSHETRFAYSSDTLRASAGWNLFREYGVQNVPFTSEEGIFLQCVARLVPNLPCVASNGTVAAAGATALLTRGLATSLPYRSVFENQGNNDSYSVFADATWSPNAKWDLTAGVRLLGEKRRSGYYAEVARSVITGGASLIPGQVDTGRQVFRDEDSFSAVLPRFNALYRLNSEVNVFATVSKGRRSPTVQLGARATPTGPAPSFTPVAEENVWNYEIGLKGGNNVVSGSIGVYYQKYDDFQVSIVREDGVIVTASAGSASNLGTEAEIQVRPTNWFNFFANVGYIDGGIDDKPGIAPNFRGARFRLQPEVQSAAGFTIESTLGNGMRLFATPSVTYRGKIFFEVPNNPAISQEAVTLVNLRAGVAFAGDKWEIVAYARNLLDENYLLDAGNTGGAFGIPTFIPAEPRLYGLQVSTRF
ncbi:MAG: TonB-dependent receptor [Gammaproteobacteria bacterium]|nr:TonB-dependent receptor [Gammaproteobacteria bacterium]